MASYLVLSSFLFIFHMNKVVLNHYKQFGTYTYPGCYKDYLKGKLPNDIEKIGFLVRKNLIHRTTLAAGNRGTNRNLRFGDMKLVPWWRQPEDAVLVTASSMLAELFRRDTKGLTLIRKVENKLVLTCRYTSILVASILKSKGIPCRVRSGHAPYFNMGKLGKIATDHWINQYWSNQEKRWITIDVDGSLSISNKEIDPYNLQDAQFNFPARSWLDIRSGNINPNYFYNAGHVFGAVTVLWALFYDFHSLMNNEIHYMHGHRLGEVGALNNAPEKELKKIDKLALLMLEPDKNFEEIKRLYSTDKNLRLLSGTLL